MFGVAVLLAVRSVGATRVFGPHELVAPVRSVGVYVKLGGDRAVLGATVPGPDHPLMTVGSSAGGEIRTVFPNYNGSITRNFPGSVRG